MSDLTGNDTRSAKKRMPDSRLFALRLIVVLSPTFISMKGYREGEEPRNRSAKMRRVMCVKTITRVVLTEKCYADAVTCVS